MPVVNSAGRAVGTTIKGARLTARGGRRTARWVGRNVGNFRRRGGAGDTGMMRLLDLHAASCAGDTLVAMGLAGTVFFNADVGQARGRVALYLLITMVPFALLAPIVGPLLDRFRHGRRYALAVTMLGRAFLGWLISDYIHGFGLYPAAFGVLALSRAYGVARSAAVPRLLPEGLGLSEAGARASIFGTLAGAVIAPLGLLAFTVGPQWPLRVASVVFIAGAVVALRLPPMADSDPPEVLPRVFQLPGRRGVKVLQGRLIVATLAGSCALRALYGFLTLFLAFAIKSGDVSTAILGHTLHQTTALAVAVGSLGAGSLVATAVGAGLNIRRPLLLQAVGILAVALTAIAASMFFSLALVILLGLVAAVASGLAKLAVDATIQERTADTIRASAFAHSETLLMLAWVLGGGLGLIQFPGRVGIVLCAVGMAVTAARGVLLAVRLRRDKLIGSYADGPQTGVATVELPPERARSASAKTKSRRGRRKSGDATTTVAPAAGGPVSGGGLGAGGLGAGGLGAPVGGGPGVGGSGVGDPGLAGLAVAGAGTGSPSGSVGQSTPAITDVMSRGAGDQPGYHLYRPSTLDGNGRDRHGHGQGSPSGDRDQM